MLKPKALALLINEPRFPGSCIASNINNLSDNSFFSISLHTPISDTIPENSGANGDMYIEHEATVSKVNEEQLFYLMSRGLTEAEATEMIVMGFIEPFSRELPMEYAVELNRLIKLEMTDSIG